MVEKFDKKISKILKSTSYIFDIYTTRYEGDLVLEILKKILKVKLKEYLSLNKMFMAIIKGDR